MYLTLSGGLIGARHGVGDTGVFQNIDTMWRLQGKIKKFYGPQSFQPEVKGGTIAADHSHAGTGAVVTVSIWERPEGLPEYKHNPEKDG
jgi:acetyl-CoA acetyltransferase